MEDGEEDGDKVEREFTVPRTLEARLRMVLITPEEAPLATPLALSLFVGGRGSSCSVVGESGETGEVTNVVSYRKYTLYGHGQSQSQEERGRTSYRERKREIDGENVLLVSETLISTVWAEPIL